MRRPDSVNLVMSNDLVRNSRLTKRAQAWTSGTPPAVGNTETLWAYWDRWHDAASQDPDGGVRDFAAFARRDPDIAALFDSIFGNSPYLGRCLIRDPGFARLLIEDGPDWALVQGLAMADDRTGLGTETQQDVMRRLRVAKRRLAITVALADIMSAWPFEKLTGALSDFATAALRASCSFLLREAHESGDLELPSPEAPEDGSGLIVLGMGKLGASELNYSSDIDIILFFDEAVVPLPAGKPASRIYARLSRNLVGMMQERTADGYVFRTDLQLRPDPGSTALALPVSAARQYYESVGRTWERAAMIKAYPVAGDIEAGTAFLEVLRRFVWRRHLDFAAAHDIRAIKQQINAHRGADARDGINPAGHNIKLGRGGIREIEFFAQTQQLIWGGRDPGLRDRRTLKTLDGLVAAGHLGQNTCTELTMAYKFHRRVEHRLQMIEDQQTHNLPTDTDGMRRLAVFLGFDSPETFVAEIRSHLQAVERHYATLFAERPDIEDLEDLTFTAGDIDSPDRSAIIALGYTEPDRVTRIVQGWFEGRFPALRTARSQDLLEKLVPPALRAFAATPDPDHALLRFDRFLARLTSGVQLLSLLNAHPALLDLVAEIMGFAPRFADWLTHQPLLLESVLSRDFAEIDPPGDVSAEAGVTEAARRVRVRAFYSQAFTASEMAAQLAAIGPTDDFQDLLITERRWANDSIFRVGVHILRGLLTPVEAARPLSDIADTCLNRLMPAIEAEFVANHGTVAGGRVAVAAFGKLGSREMTINSDLDLLFLYDHVPDAPASDGRRPLAPGQYYSRMCRRLITAITAPTAEGKLYDVDMRLRPSGRAGPIACSLEAFGRYQESSAWTWEHQALTRARLVYAEGRLGDRFDEIRHSVLARRRDRDALAKDVAEMRGRIRREHGSGVEQSIKLRTGGLVDVEFAAQFLQLLHGADTPQILAGDAISVFEIAGVHDLLDPDVAGDLAEATRLWRNLQGILRLTVGQESVSSDSTADSLGIVGRFYGELFRDSFNELVNETAERVARHIDTLLA